jgi:anti-sigma-K factor RskA
MTADVHALTGAYVLDAVSELERAAFERHLAECEACGQEVRELRETAARLGQAADAGPPPELRSRVMATISGVRQLPPEPAFSGELPLELGRRRGGWTLRLMSAAAAVFLVATVVLGVLLVRESGSARDSRQYADSLIGLLQSGDARVASNTATTGGTATVVVSRSRDKALVLASGMPSLGGGKVYEAWLIQSDGSMKEAGLLSGSPLDVPGVGTAKGIGLTVEPPGGSRKPSLPPIAQVDFPAV